MFITSLLYCFSGKLFSGKLILLFVLLCCLTAVEGGANNVRITGEPDLSLNTSNDTVKITCKLSWDNSWRDEFNWDAVWLFVKYKQEKAETSAWDHLYLGSSADLPSDMACEAGKTAGKTAGIFVFRNAQGAGHLNDKQIVLKAALNSFTNISAEDIKNKRVYVSVSAVEMVMIPTGAYYLGDTASISSFMTADKLPVCLESEAAKDLSVLSGTKITVPAGYPKGYRGFYCMKYELSQEQYVSFLNMLDNTRQQKRIGNALTGLVKGDYVFGDKNRPNARNGIALFQNEGGGKPAQFANNLNPAEPFYASDDGQTLACNFLTLEDMLAYCDWAGLRPMSELEYEKACRRPYPQPIVPKDYAWNTRTLSSLTGLADLVDAGTENEHPADKNKNVNAGTTFGPVRCGSFGFDASTQVQSGGSFWGVMEMSGNLGELCYKATGGGEKFTATDINTSHGDGVLAATGLSDMSTAIWPAATTTAAFAIRGGCFTSKVSELQVSDRSRIAIAVIRDSTLGFRGVRTFDGGRTITAGNIACANGLVGDTACPGGSYTITNISPAVVAEAPDAVIKYMWYVNDVLVEGEIKPTLTYDFVNNGTTLLSYTVKRKAVCSYGDAITNILTIKVPNTTVDLNVDRVSLSAGNNTDTVKITPKMKGVIPVYTWKYGNRQILGNAVYVADQKDFNGVEGDVLVVCEANVMGCLVNKELTVQVEREFACGQTVTDTRDGKVYPTVKIGNDNGANAQCWFQQSLNVGTYITAPTTTNFWTFQTAGIQKICLDNIPANCDLYGALYQWWEAVCDGKCNSKLTTANALSVVLNSESNLITYGAKMVPGSTKMVQGICPDGWHLPSDEETKRLEMNLGMSREEADKIGYRGTNEGTKMKMPGFYNGVEFCSGALCNSSGFGMMYGGAVVFYANPGTFYFDRAGFWTSTPLPTSYAWSRWLLNTAERIHRDEDGITRSWGVGIRCLKN